MTSARIVRWWIVGTAFTALNIPVLYMLVEIARLPLAAASVVAGETGLLARFFVNDRWVFQHSRPSWRRLWQYHVAAAGGFVIWWTVTNVLPKLGVHYVAAALAGTGCSVGWSMVTNFLWVWRRRADPPTVAGDSRDA